MRNILFLLEKEFRQIFRDKAILRMIMLMPIIQLIIIPLAANFEVKNIRVTVLDQDHSSLSNELTHKLDASNYLNITSIQGSEQKGIQAMDEGNTDVMVIIPHNFERDLIRTKQASVFLTADAVNGVKAGMGTAYVNQIIQDYNQNLGKELGIVDGQIAKGNIEIKSRQWYNPHLKYHSFMVPGILGILVTMVGSFLTALNIVSEKEMGTMEQINVSPITKFEFIMGKLIPFWVLGMISISLGMVVGVVVYALWPVGSVFTILALSSVYLMAVLGVGLLISTFVENQQQATLVAFFVMMIFILMSGLFTPIESMPDWAQWIDRLNPPMYFIHAIRAVYLKGSSLGDIRNDLFMSIIFAVVFNTLAILNYRKTSAG